MKPELNKKTQKEIEALPSAESWANRADKIISAYNLLRHIGYEHPEIMDVLSVAHFLTEEDPD